jgi:hypothetical protein
MQYSEQIRPNKNKNNNYNNNNKATRVARSDNAGKHICQNDPGQENIFKLYKAPN